MFFFPFRDDNPTNTKPFISWFLIAVCSFVFIYQMGLSSIDFNNFVRFFGITPTNFLNNTNNQWFTAISSMFVHGNLTHLIGNMVYLWIFGDNIEDSFGKIRFIIFYILCVFAASPPHLVLFGAAISRGLQRYSSLLGLHAQMC